MKTITVKTARELKGIDRDSIQEINGINFSGIYPMLEISNKHVSYYDAEKGNVYLSKPFNVVVKDSLLTETYFPELESQLEELTIKTK